MKDTFVLKAKEVHSPSLGFCKDSTLVIEKGKIKTVGNHKKISLPQHCQEYDFSKYRIYPGFIEAHGHITVVGESIGSIGNDGNDYFDPVHPQLRIRDSINLDTPELQAARQGGVVAVAIFPGSSVLIGGLGTMIKTTCRSLVISEAVIKDNVGLKMAFGENPKRVFSSEKKFYTRSGAVALLREYFTAVQHYAGKKSASTHKKKGDLPFETNIRFETGLRLLNREFPARAHAHQANDIQNAVELSEEFGFDLVIEHGTEADQIVDYLKSRPVSVVVGPISSPGLKIETRKRSLSTPAVLIKNGIRTALMTDAPVYNISLLRILAGLTMSGGMRYEDTLKALTIEPARICGIADRYGDIKPGLEAHLVVWDGDPLRDIQARVIAIVDQNDVWDMTGE